MNFLTTFFQTLFSGTDPAKIALWVRGLFIGVFGALAQGVIDILVQVLGFLNSGAPIAISWQLVARTVAIAVIPAVILYLKDSKGADTNEKNQ